MRSFSPTIAGCAAIVAMPNISGSAVIGCRLDPDASAVDTRIAAQPAAVPPIPAIVALSSDAPSIYGPQLTTAADTATFTPGGATSTSITVTAAGDSNSYFPGYLHVPGISIAEAYAEIDFTAEPAAGSTAIYAMKLVVDGAAPTGTAMSRIIQDINSEAARDGNIAASAPTGAAIAEFGSNYNIELVAPAYSTAFLGFSFEGETNVAGVAVTDIAAVPEPASLLAVVMGACGSLLGRRRNRK